MTHNGPVTTPQQGLAALRAAAASGALDVVCRRHRVRALTVFGSTAHGASDPSDLDVGVLVEPGAGFDRLAFVNDLEDLSGTDSVDVAHLNNGGPLIRERALVGSVPLFESRSGAIAEAQIAAVLERMDTDWMRRLDLELMAG